MDSDNQKVEGDALIEAKKAEQIRPPVKLSLAAAFAMGIGMTHSIERNAQGRPATIRQKTKGEVQEHLKKKSKRKAASAARKRNRK